MKEEGLVVDRHECASAEWSVSRAYGSEAFSVNATVLVRRDVANEDEEDGEAGRVASVDEEGGE